MAIQGEGTQDAAARRVKALELAVDIAGHQQVGNYDGNTIVNIARLFEKYLADD